METINVIILPNVRAKEVNQTGEEPIRGIAGPNNGLTQLNFNRKRRDWQEAEDKLRTFDIEYCTVKIVSIHKAEILNNTTVRIID